LTSFRRRGYANWTSIALTRPIGIRFCSLGLLPGILLLSVACAERPTRSWDAGRSGYPVGYVERGRASWYGPGFHGNQTANGERYDMHQLTAAHRTLPFGSVARVRSLTTGRNVTVRINDRGPFAKNRILDLSHAAAEALGMIGRGTDDVELAVTAYQGRSGGFGFLIVQVASFAERSNAEALAARLRGEYSHVRLQPADLSEGRRYRVQVGHFKTEQQAQAVGEKLGSELDVEALILRDDR
jgi:peptidoglycan lytic transglycosylase